MSFGGNSQPLVSFTIPYLAPVQFLQHFWVNNNTFFESFLTNELQNHEIYMQPWQTWASSDEHIPEKSKEGCVLVRDVSSLHPITSKQAYLKLLMGFLPSYAPSKKRQYILMSPLASSNNGVDDGSRDYSILEEARFEKLPFCEYFHVKTLWTLHQGTISAFDQQDDINKQCITTHQEGSKDVSLVANKQKTKSWLAWMHKEDHQEHIPLSTQAMSTNVKVYVEMHFNKPLLLQELLRSNTFKELKEVLESWGKAAIQDVQSLGSEIHRISPQLLDSTFLVSSTSTSSGSSGSSSGWNGVKKQEVEEGIGKKKKKTVWDHMPWNQSKQK